MRDPNSVLISLILKGNERKLGKALKRGADVNKLDEFPYARTKEGGWGAVAHMVDRKQHLLQAGYFGVFCRWTMRGTPQPFIVVPIPL